jgi:hypothetical protein
VTGKRGSSWLLTAALAAICHFKPLLALFMLADDSEGVRGFRRSVMVDKLTQLDSDSMRFPFRFTMWRMNDLKPCWRKTRTNEMCDRNGQALLKRE